MKKLLVILILLGSLAPLYSADFQFYGKIRLGAWWEKSDSWYDDTVSFVIDSTIDTIILNDTLYKMDTTSAGLGPDSLPMYYTSFIPNGYLGIKFRTDRLEIITEVGVKKTMYDGRNSCVTSNMFLARRNHFIYMRKWYIDWYVNDFLSFLFGKDASPVNFTPSNQGYYTMNSFANTGGVDGGANPMIQLTLGNASSVEEGIRWETKLAVLNPDTTYIDFRGNHDVDVGMRVPKFESSANIGFSSGIFELSGEACYGFQRYYLSSPLPMPVDSCEGNVDAYVAGGHAQIKIGPVSIDWTGAVGKNLGNYGLYITNPWVWFGGVNPELVNIFYAFWPAGEDIKNSFAKEMAVILKLQFSEAFRIEMGGGVVAAEHDDEFRNSLWHNTYATYLQTDIKLVDALFITPEIGGYFYGPEIGFGRRLYAGLQVRGEF